MKKLILFGMLFLPASIILGAPLFTESPIKSVGTPVTVAISSTTQTKVPTDQLSGRVGVYISNPSTNTIAGFMGNCTSTTLASTIRPFELGRTTNLVGDASMLYLPMREDVCLWLISIDVTAASKNIHYQEVVK